MYSFRYRMMVGSIGTALPRGYAPLKFSWRHVRCESPLWLHRKGARVESRRQPRSGCDQQPVSTASPQVLIESLKLASYLAFPNTQIVEFAVC